MINTILDILSKVNNSFIINKIDKNNLYKLINWNILNNIFNNSHLDSVNFDLEENKYLSLEQFLNKEKSFILKNLHLFDFHILNFTLKLSKIINAYITMNLEVDNTCTEKELSIRNNEMIFFQVYGDCDIKVFDNENKECYLGSLNEGDYLYLPNNYKVIKKSKSLGMYLHFYLFRISNVLYMEWLSKNIKFDDSFIIDPISIKEEMKKFLHEFKSNILEIIDYTNSDYLKKQMNILNNPIIISFPDIFFE
jgi:hypothetical protein